MGKCVKCGGGIGLKGKGNVCGKHKYSNVSVVPSFSFNKEAVELDVMALQVCSSFDRLAELGGWPDFISSSTLVDRLPEPYGKGNGGFDAGLACALDLIPADKQRLSAQLHAAHSAQAIQKIRDDRKQIVDSETMWWAAACYVCSESKVNESEFLEQVNKFVEFSEDIDMMVRLAEHELDVMCSSYNLVDGVPYAVRNGGVIGAYIDGYDFGVEWSDKYNIFFVSTFRDSLGLEDFVWKDDNGNSGPVHGSKQFVKACDEEELNLILERMRMHSGVFHL